MPMVTIACPCDGDIERVAQDLLEFLLVGNDMVGGQHRHDAGGGTRADQRRAERDGGAGVAAHRLGDEIVPSGIFGSCLRTSGNCASLVMTKMFFAGTSGSTRSTASCKKDFLPSSASSCLGIFSRLNGQKRSPRPPAMMMTNRSLVSVFAFIFLLATDSRRD